jgi:hypothetical protein
MWSAKEASTLVRWSSQTRTSEEEASEKAQIGAGNTIKTDSNEIRREHGFQIS